MVRLRKKIEASYLCGIRVAHQRYMWQNVCMYTVYPYLFALHSLHFPHDLQFQVIDISVFSSLTMTQTKKHVRTLRDRLKIIQEVEKNPGEKCVDIAKQLGLPASTLNSIFAKKNEIRKQIQKCGNARKKRKTGK
jgi:hypothetical protein